ncbi:MAG TPA: hypothetical protein VF841_04675, partial [Anaeromyxobacter sp.]
MPIDRAASAPARVACPPGAQPNHRYRRVRLVAVFLAAFFFAAAVDLPAAVDFLAAADLRAPAFAAAWAEAFLAGAFATAFGGGGGGGGSGESSPGSSSLALWSAAGAPETARYGPRFSDSTVAAR